jgi:hypothetical protein
LTIPAQTNASITTGTISNWPESGPKYVIGDGTNHVTLFWSIVYDDHGWFYGSGQLTDSDVAFASGITKASQITDASIFTFTNSSIGPHPDADADPDGTGDFIIWQNISTGHYGVLRIDDIHIPAGGGWSDAKLDGTWWFQGDGTGNFISAPGAVILAGPALRPEIRLLISGSSGIIWVNLSHFC